MCTCIGMYTANYHLVWPQPSHVGHVQHYGVPCHFFGVSMATIVTVCDAGATPRTNFNNCDSDSSGALALQI